MHREFPSGHWSVLMYSYGVFDYWANNHPSLTYRGNRGHLLQSMLHSVGRWTTGMQAKRPRSCFRADHRHYHRSAHPNDNGAHRGGNLGELSWARGPGLKSVSVFFGDTIDIAMRVAVAA